MARHRGNAISGWITGAAIGTGLMYLADPNCGKRRRALVRDKVTHGFHMMGCAGDKAVRDLRNRTWGTAAELRAKIRREQVPDKVLNNRVRAKIGRAVSHPSAIEVSTTDGNVVLSGPVLEAEAERLLECAASVRGVRNIESRLEKHKTPENVPDLQGGASVRHGQRAELLQESWAPGTRLLVGVSSALALAFPTRNRAVALPSRILGTLLLTRAITNLPIRRLFGTVRSRRAVRFQKTITIHEPIEHVFQFWSNPENFARVMSHVEEVTKTGEGKFRWKVCGPAGSSFSWESHITEMVPNQLLAWRSEPGSLIGNAGIIRFQSDENGATRVHLLMSYNPPAGAIGNALATLFGVGPKNALNDDMPRLKSLFEQGKTTAHGQRVTREQVSV